MKIGVVADSNTHLEVPFLFQIEGHQVRLLAPSKLDCLPGILERVRDPQELVDWGPDLVVFPKPTAPALAVDLEELKIPVFGSSPMQCNLMNNPAYWASIAVNTQLPTGSMVFGTSRRYLVQEILKCENPEQEWERIRTDSTDRFKTKDVLDVFGDEDEGDTVTLQLLRKVLPEERSFNLAVLSSWHGICEPSFTYQNTHRLFNGGMDTVEGIRVCPLDLSESKSMKKLIADLNRLFRVFRYIGWAFLKIKEVSPEEFVIDNITSEVPEGFWSAFSATLSKDFTGLFPRITKPGRRGRNRSIYLYPEREGKAYRVSVPPYPSNRRWPGLDWLPQTCEYTLAGRPENLLPTSGIKVSSDPGSSVVEVIHAEIGWLTNRGPIHKTIELLRESIPDIQVRPDQSPLEFSYLESLGVSKHKGDQKHVDDKNDGAAREAEPDRSHRSDQQRSNGRSVNQEKKNHHRSQVRGDGGKQREPVAVDCA